MKKRIFALMAIICALVLVGCGNRTQAPTQAPTKPTQPTQQADEHVFGTWISQVDATCTQDGVLGHYHCTHCNKDFDADHNELSSLVIPKGHKLGQFIDEVPATFGTKGVKGHYHGSVCEKDFDADKNELTSLDIAEVTEMKCDFNAPAAIFQYGGWNGQEAELDGIKVYEGRLQTISGIRRIGAL